MRVFRLRWLERARVVGAVLCFAAAGGLVAWVLGASAPVGATSTNVSIRAGATIVPDRDPGTIARELAARWDRTSVQLVLPGRPPIVRTRRALGARVDVERLRELLTQARDPSSVMRRVHAERAQGSRSRQLRIPLPLVLDERALFDHLADLKDGYDQPPRDARADLHNGRIIPHQNGRVLDVHGTLEALHAAFLAERTQVRASVVERAPHRTAHDLEGLRMDAVLGSFETRYNTLEEARDRSFNLGVAASKLDGVVVLPGETFDFNAAVGERSQANGFRPAPVIAAGELVDGVGGGTCQVAGTLHAAVFFAGLPIVERSSHSRPSTYLYMGLDAVVAYPQLNLRFTNDLSFPVAIGFTVAGGIVRAEIRGRETHRMVTFSRRIDQITPYDQREVQDPTLPAGVRVLRQRGVPGFRIRAWRIVRDVEVNQALRTHRQDVYPPTSQIWRVGSGGAAPADYRPPEGDTHPEYTADAYLSVIQGAGIEGTQIIRRNGQSGTPGWTSRMGMPQADPAR